jgi:hypothetical protein
VNAYRSLDGGQDIVFIRMSYADAAAGTDTFCLWCAAFAGDDQVAGYGATLPQAAADLTSSSGTPLVSPRPPVTPLYEQAADYVAGQI